MQSEVDAMGLSVLNVIVLQMELPQIKIQGFFPLSE